MDTSSPASMLSTAAHQVSSTHPKDNTTDIYPSSNISAIFSKDMNVNSLLNLPTMTEVGSESGTHRGAISYDSGSNTLTFNPDINFAYNEKITVTITAEAQDLGGNSLDGNGNGIAEGSPRDDYSWSFTTIMKGKVGLADTPWPMRGHDPKHRGRSPYLGAQKSTKKWEFRTGAWIISSPAIGSDGTIYVGSNDNKLYAIGEE